MGSFVGIFSFILFSGIFALIATPQGAFFQCEAILKTFNPLLSGLPALCFFVATFIAFGIIWGTATALYCQRKIIMFGSEPDNNKTTI